MKTFRFGIMGAGKIAHKFCDAVSRLENCEVTAVSSKSAERAETFAGEENIGKAYGSYEEMLQQEELDCIYIATLPNEHFRLTMLCLDYDTPVLCEKAMFMNGEEAETVFARAAEKKIFVMEAMWSRFLPAVLRAKHWVDSGKIGKVRFIDMGIGFAASKEKVTGYGGEQENRFMNPELGGGAAHDITVYAYEIATYMMDEPILKEEVSVVRGETGVDLTEHITLLCKDSIASLAASLATPIDRGLIVYGDEGKVVVPGVHHSREAFLFDKKGTLQEHFQDETEENGFVHEIKEVVECVRNGRHESSVVPYELTIACSKLFDRIAAK